MFASTLNSHRVDTVAHSIVSYFSYSPCLTISVFWRLLKCLSHTNLSSIIVSPPSYGTVLHYSSLPCFPLFFRGMVVSPEALLLHKTLSPPNSQSHLDYNTKHDGFHTVCFTQSPAQPVPTVRRGERERERRRMIIIAYA